MRRIKKILTIILTLTLSTALATDNCDKCDINKVKIVNAHIDSLTFQAVSEFLCTFDASCINNVEYSEWSNETLFKVLNKAPAIFFQVIAKGQVDKNLLLKEVESPIHDLIDLSKTYNNLKSASAPSDTKSQFLNAVIIAADKIGLEIKK